MQKGLLHLSEGIDASPKMLLYVKIMQNLGLSAERHTGIVVFDLPLGRLIDRTPANKQNRVGEKKKKQLQRKDRRWV